jgi:hypothetical protein
VRILAVSDEVAEPLWTPDVRRYEPDLVVGCGDVPFDLLAWIADTTETPLVFVPGNHDPDLGGYRHTRRGLVLRAGIPVTPPWPPGAINADGRVVDVAGVRIAGLGGSRRYQRGPNQYTERQQARRVRRLISRVRHRRPSGPVDIVIAHAPIAGVGDTGPDDPVHQGFQAFHRLVARLQPDFFLYGHVKGAASRTEHRIGATRVVNVFDHQLLELDRGAVPAGGDCSSMARSTGFPDADAADDFQRLRRRQVLARLAQRLRREPDDVTVILPFDEVVAVLGVIGERHLGNQTISVDSIVGSVDRTRDFDRRFRPTSGRSRERWERIAAASRRGEAMPPISVYRVGDMHFVRDGHHRVSVARAMGQRLIDADVTEVRTRIPARGIRSVGDLVYKDYERLFRERVPLPPEAQATLSVRDPWLWAELSETVEAWGFRLIQHEGRFIARAEVAKRWYDDEYRRVVRMLRAADLIGARTDAEAYLQVAAERYRLIRTHEWNDEVIARLRSELHGH